jgi:uncharacterized protein (UPF0335 family)
VKNQLVAAAVAAALGFGCVAPGIAQAASNDELAQIRSQLLGLIERVDRLEAENTTLEGENDQLKAQAEKVAEQVAKQAVEASKQSPPAVKAADWPNRISLKGDIRYRHQQTDDENASADREEDLLRARLGLEAKVNDAMVAGFGVTTSSAPGNPRGANQQLDGEFSRKSLYLDLAYFDWTFAKNAHLIGGKMKMPFFRPGQSLFWDNDINPEGLAVTYSSGSRFGSAWGYWIEENVQTGTAASTATSTDTRMFGFQVGNRFDFGSTGNLVVAGSYYDLAAAQGRRPFYNGSPNGNSLTSTGGLSYDFQVIDLVAEFNTKLGELPLQVWADAAQNRDSEFDTAYSFGAVMGKASGPGGWETGLGYQLIEKDALFAQHIDSDFAGGSSDADGWVLRAGYAPLKNWVLNATYFLNRNNRDVGSEYDFKRLMLDFNAKF